MRIAFLTNKTTSVNLPLFEHLVGSKDHQLAHTFFYDTVSESCQSPLAVIARLGARRVAVKMWQTVTGAARTGLGKFLGTHCTQLRSPYELAVAHKLPHSVIKDMNDPETIGFLSDLDVDVLIVCVCKNILRKQVLSLPGISYVNIHPSLLPKYRGPAPTFWMLYNREKVTGITFHLMTTRIDEGPILAQASMPLDLSMSESQIEGELFKVAATVLGDVLQNLHENTPPNTLSVQQTDASYYTFPTPRQRRELTRMMNLRKSSSRHSGSSDPSFEDNEADVPAAPLVCPAESTETAKTSLPQQN